MRSWPLRRARGAKAMNHEMLKVYTDACGRGQLVCQPLKRDVFQLDDRFAAPTYEMVMGARDMRPASDLVAKFHLDGKAMRLQRFEGAIDRDWVDGRIARQHPVANLVHASVLMRFTKDLQDGNPCRRRMESMLAQVSLQGFDLVEARLFVTHISTVHAGGCPLDRECIFSLCHFAGKQIGRFG